MRCPSQQYVAAAVSRYHPIKDVDGDGSISPEELIQILTSLGESPGDLNLYFAGMATDTTTDYRPVVSWLTFLLKHSKLKIEQKNEMYFKLMKIIQLVIE